MGWSKGSDWNWSFNQNVFKSGDNENYKALLKYSNTNSYPVYILDCTIQLGCGANGSKYKKSDGSWLTSNGSTCYINQIFVRRGNDESQTLFDEGYRVDLTGDVTGSPDYNNITQHIIPFNNPVKVEPNETIEFLFDFNKSKSGTSPTLIARHYQDPTTFGGTVISSMVKVYTNSQWKNAQAYVYTDGEWKLTIPQVYNNSKWNIVVP